MGLCNFLWPTPEHQFGPQAIQFHRQFPIPVIHICYVGFMDDNRRSSKTNSWRCFSGGQGGGGSRWDWEENVHPKHKQMSRFSDDYATYNYDEEAKFEFRNFAKQRIWWYDESDAEDEDDVGDNDGFRILESSIQFNWVLKVFQAFGWMIPAVVISLLVGSGPNTIIMALALPLAQSAFSLFADTFILPNESPRPKSKTKKRPPAGRGRTRRERQTRTARGKEAGNYKSWVDANNASVKNGKTSLQGFGGWDELDNQVRMEKDKNPCVENTDEPRIREGVKISRRVKGDTPLFVRLLTAMFPFWGFWTKLF